MGSEVTFRAELLSTGKTTTGIVVPAEVVERLGSGKRPAVNVTINGYTYRNTIGVMGGDFMISVSAEIRQKAGVSAGDLLDVRLELDTAPREIAVPADLQAALDTDEAAKRFFEGLSYSNKQRHVLNIEGTKNPETRQRRIEKSVSSFREGKA